MSLSDIAGAQGDTFLIQVALVIFFLVFLGVVAYVVFRRKGAWERARRLPLEDDLPTGDDTKKVRTTLSPEETES